MMKLNRLLLTALLALTLLLSQHGGIAHAFTHALTDQSNQNKHPPQSPACELCAVYAQMGSALSSVVGAALLIASPAAAIGCGTFAFHSILPPAAIARGPPAKLQKPA